MLDKKLLTIGHLGIGSLFGSTPIGEEINDKQRWINSVRIKHKQIIGIPNEYPTDVIYLGENIEGSNPNGKHKDIYLPYKSDQIENVVKVMLEYIGLNTENIYMVYSHEYHEEYTREIADKLDLELRKNGLNPNIEVLPFKETIYYEKTFRFIHGNGGSGKNRSPKLESDLKENSIRADFGDVPSVDYMFGSHSHRIAGVRIGRKEYHTIPCYKLMDTEGEKRNPDTWFPDIGLTMVTFEQRFGEIRINIDNIIDKVPFRFNDLLIEKRKWEDKMKTEIYELKPEKVFEEMHISKTQQIGERTKIEERHVSRRE